MNRRLRRRRKTPEDAERTVRQPPSVACDADRGDDVAAVVLHGEDTPALRERVQRSLLALRDVYWENRLI